LPTFVPDRWNLSALTPGKSALPWQFCLRALTLLFPHLLSRTALLQLVQHKHLAKMTGFVKSHTISKFGNSDASPPATTTKVFLLKSSDAAKAIEVSRFTDRQDNTAAKITPAMRRPAVINVPFRRAR
jgi:hypothetical protein